MKTSCGPATLIEPEQPTLAPGDRLPSALVHGEQQTFKASARNLEESRFEKREAPYRLGPNHTGLEWKKLDVREQVIVSALLRQYLPREFPGDPYTVGTEYKVGKAGREVSLKAPTPAQLESLVERFTESPRTAFAAIRRNLIAIGKDPNLSDKVRMNRLGDYFDASVMVTLRLDDLAFQRDHAEQNVRKGAPPYYLPNGFVDLGMEPGLKPNQREREKITVDKGALFSDARAFLLTAYANAIKDDQGMISVKREMLRDVATWVQGKITYGPGDVEPVTDPVDRRLEGGIGVCRHYAMTVQLLNQQLGLNSRLIKIDYCVSREKDGRFAPVTAPGRHAANLTRVESAVSVLDVTHSDSSQIKLFDLDRAFALRDMDVTEPRTFRFARRDGLHAEYSLKSNGYWTIRSLERLESSRSGPADEEATTPGW